MQFSLEPMKLSASAKHEQTYAEADVVIECCCRGGCPNGERGELGDDGASEPLVLDSVGAHGSCVFVSPFADAATDLELAEYLAANVRIVPLAPPLP